MSNIGHNSGDITPLMQHTDNINELYDEAKLWLDGEPIPNDAQAEAVVTLIDMMRKASKAAEKSRMEETRPLEAKKKQIIADYKPCIVKADLAVKKLKEATAAYIMKKEEERKRIEALERAEQERLQREAEELAKSASLEDAEKADAMNADAAHIEKEIKRMQREKNNVPSQTGRAISIRTYYRFNLTDENAALRHFWGTAHGRAALIETACKLANQDARDGIRKIPGFELVEEKRAV